MEYLKGKRENVNWKCFPSALSILKLVWIAFKLSVPGAK
jgi:hypothetical protein